MGGEGEFAAAPEKTVDLFAAKAEEIKARREKEAAGEAASPKPDEEAVKTLQKELEESMEKLKTDHPGHYTRMMDRRARLEGVTEDEIMEKHRTATRKRLL